MIGEHMLSNLPLTKQCYITVPSESTHFTYVRTYHLLIHVNNFLVWKHQFC